LIVALQRGVRDEGCGKREGGREVRERHTLCAELIVCLVSSALAFISGGGTENDDENALNPPACLVSYGWDDKKVLLSLIVIGGATSGAVREEENVDWRGGIGDVALCGRGDVDRGGRDEPWNVLYIPRRDAV
jgi:hypothetical protein